MGTPGTHHMNFDQVQRSASRLASEKADIEQKLKQLKGMIDSLVSSDFVTQQASRRFQQSYQDWNLGATKVMTGLDGMSQFLNTAITRHRDLDSDLSRQTGG